AKALFAGIAAHALQPLTHPLSASIGLGILAAGHRHGWAVAEGGSQRITDAMASLLLDYGGTIETGQPIHSVDQLPRPGAVIWDVAPAALAEILGDRLPSRIARAYRRFLRGPGVFKVDFAVDGGIPWRAEMARYSGTVHLGGTLAEITKNEQDIH